MSIHKSQGQTLQRVKVNLAKVFEKGEESHGHFRNICNTDRCMFIGQAYVALSRATSLDGLQVLQFDPRKVRSWRNFSVRFFDTLCQGNCSS